MNDEEKKLFMEFMTVCVDLDKDKLVNWLMALPVEKFNSIAPLSDKLGAFIELALEIKVNQT